MGISLGEFAAVIAVSVTIITGLVSLIMNAQYQRMRREITEEISTSRHKTIETVITNLSEVKLALDDKVEKGVYALQIHALERRQDFVERLVTSRPGGSEHTGHA